MDRDHRSSASTRSLVVVARIATYALHWYLIAVEVILGLGFVLLLLGANPSSEFTRWVYRSLDRAMGPFRGMFEPIVIDREAVSSVFDTSILFAMIIYALVLLLVGTLLRWLTERLRRIDVDERMRAQQEAYRQDLVVPRSDPPDVVGDLTRPGSAPEAGS